MQRGAAPRQKLFVIHENPAWFKPIKEALESRSLPYSEWILDEGGIDLSGTPPEGIYFSKMSASAHTRGHAHAPDYAFALFAWLEAHGCKIINGGSVLRLEISKAAQYAALEASGIKTPRTIVCFGRDSIIKEAEKCSAPYILKPNRGGKGLGVKLFHDLQSLRTFVQGDGYEEPVDNILLLQEYIQSPEPYITRFEFIGGKLLYAVRVDTSEGFELCPAEACRANPVCALDGDENLFHILPDFRPPIVEKYERFLVRNNIGVAGIECIADSQGILYTYDINTNTNYNPAAEAKAGVSGIDRLIAFLYV